MKKVFAVSAFAADFWNKFAMLNKELSDKKLNASLRYLVFKFDLYSNSNYSNNSNTLSCSSVSIHIKSTSSMYLKYIKEIL